MNEGFQPTPESDPIENQAEQGPKSYEELLDIARSLKLETADDYTDSQNPEALELRVLIVEWESTLAIPDNGVETPEQAKNRIKVSRLLVDAGHVDESFIADAQDALFVELNLTRLKPETEEAVAVLEDGTEDLQRLLEMKKPERIISASIEAAMEAAATAAESGKFVEAVQILTGRVLLMTPYKKFFERNPDRKAEIIRQRDAYKDAMLKQKAENKRTE